MNFIPWFLLVWRSKQLGHQHMWFYNMDLSWRLSIRNLNAERRGVFLHSMIYQIRMKIFAIDKKGIISRSKVIYMMVATMRHLMLTSMIIYADHKSHTDFHAFRNHVNCLQDEMSYSCPDCDINDFITYVLFVRLCCFRFVISVTLGCFSHVFICIDRTGVLLSLRIGQSF